MNTRMILVLCCVIATASLTGCAPAGSPSTEDLVAIEAEVSTAMGLAVEPTKIEDGESPDSGPDPDNRPKPGDKCKVCNDPPGKCGAGKVGDGTHCYRCDVCGGDGKVDDQDMRAIIGTPIGVAPSMSHHQIPAVVPVSVGDSVLEEPEPVVDVPGEQPDPGVVDPESEPFRSVTIHTTRKLAKEWGSVWWKEVRPKLEEAGWIVGLPVEYAEDEMSESFFEVNRNGVIEILYGNQPFEAFEK